MAVARIGISGWRYRPWRGVFYPPGLRQVDELAYAASHVTSIEVNGSFYSLQPPDNWRRWRDTVPDGFVFAVKGGRFITHMKRLLDAETSLANFFAQGLLELRDRLGPVLWQLPPTLQFDAGRLDAFLAALPRSRADAAALAARHDARLDGKAAYAVEHDGPLRYAVEVRHPSFETDAWAELLARHGVASVVADTAGKFPRLDVVTADFVYARLHGEEELYASGYDDASLDRWAAWTHGHLEAGRDVYAYFDNDIKVRAPFDAMGLIARLPHA